MDLLWNLFGVVRLLVIPLFVILTLQLFARYKGDPRPVPRTASNEYVLFLVAGIVFLAVAFGTGWLFGNKVGDTSPGMFVLNCIVMLFIGKVFRGAKGGTLEFAGLGLAAILYLFFGYSWLMEKLGWSTGGWGF